MAAKKSIQQTTAPRVKDPKKAAAGKARAAQAMRDKEGKYITKVLATEVKKTFLATKNIDTSKLHSDNAEKVDKVLKEAKFTEKQIAAFYKKNKDAFQQMLETGSTTGTIKNYNQLETGLKNYSGKKIFINNGSKVKEVSKAKAMLQLQKFKQYLSSELNVVDIVIKPRLSFDGEMEIKIPSTKQFEKLLRETLGAKSNEDIFDNFDSAEINDAIQQVLNTLYNDGEEQDDIMIYAS